MKTFIQDAWELLPLVLSLSLLGGCASTEDAQADATPRQVVIEKGMPAADLLAQLGEPTAIEPTDPPREGFEVWVYRRQATNVEMQVTGTKETPHYDPITGAYMPIVDPVYSSETSTFKEVTKFLIADGTVASWKVERDHNRAYNN